MILMRVWIAHHRWLIVTVYIIVMVTLSVVLQILDSTGNI